jgi:hypothetical protein
VPGSNGRNLNANIDRDDFWAAHWRFRGANSKDETSRNPHLLALILRVLKDVSISFSLSRGFRPLGRRVSRIEPHKSLNRR